MREEEGLYTYPMTIRKRLNERSVAGTIQRSNKEFHRSVAGLIQECAWCGVYDVEVLLVLGCPVLRFAKPLTVDPSDLNSVNRMPSLREAFQLGESLQDSGICNGLGHKVANSGGLCELHCSMDGVL
jgi:hypothetical protein